jgi:hypothetical protein
MDTSSFYATTSALSFTLLGFWWVVVQFRHVEMTADANTRRFSFLVLLQFLIPGLVALASLLSADPWWWRLSFGLAGLLGIAATLVGMRAALGDLRWYVWLSLPVYGAVTVVALLPDLFKSLLNLAPLQLEGVLLLAILLLGVLLAWTLFTRPKQNP